MTDEQEAKRGRVVAVTGAGTGIGQAIAAKFAALGWHVAIGGRRIDKLSETAALVEQAGGVCLPHELDVTDADSVERFFTDVEAKFGVVTAVINNAATVRYGPLDDFSPAEIALEIVTKLTGSLFMARTRDPGDATQRRRWRHPLHDVARGGDALAAAPPLRGRQRGRRARRAHPAVRARGLGHPRSSTCAAARRSAPISPPVRWRAVGRWTPTNGGSA